MTIPAGQVAFAQYTGNGVTASFDYPFTITAEAELRVVSTDLDDVDTVLELGTDYTVSGVGDSGGGSITLVAGALTSGFKITVSDNIQSSQETPFGNQSAFFASLHEASFDKLTRLTNRVLSLISGTILRIPDTVVGVSSELPKPRALALFRWNQAEDALETVLPSEIATSVAFSDFKVDQFDDGAGYTSGVSTSVTLTEAAGIINNTQVYFDGVYRAKDTYTMPNTTTIDFGAPIAGTPTIEVVYGTAVVSEDVTTAQLAAQAAAASAAASAADLVQTNADQIQVAADAAQVAADLVQTDIDQQQVAADAAQVALDLLSTDEDQQQAEASAAAAASSFAAFDIRYLGQKASDPALDNQGNALITGALYFNNTANVMKVYNGTAWSIAAVDEALVTPRDSLTGASTIPSGTEAQRPSTPVNGMIRYNAEFAQYEGYGAGGWSGLGGASGGAGNPFVYLNDIIVTEDFTIPVGKNGMSAGAITVADGVTVTVSDGSSYTVVGG